MKFAISYSAGKDCNLAMHKMILEGHTLVALVTTVNREQQRSWFHGIPESLLEASAASLGVPLIAAESTPDNYTEALVEALIRARELGAEAVAFGDIDIDQHKEYDDDVAEQAGLISILPLWKMDRDQVIDEQLNSGIKAVIKLVDKSQLDESFLGQTVTFDLVEKIKAAGADACGENGEYHTFVYDGPCFAEPVAYQTGELVDFGTHMAIDIF